MATQMLSSLGHIAVVAQLSVPCVKSMLDEIGAEPALILNGVPYYDGPAYGRVLAKTLNIPHPADKAQADE